MTLSGADGKPPFSLPPPSDALIEKMAPLGPVADVRTIVLHQAHDPFALWQAWEEECGRECPIPFWSIAWPAARMMSAHILLHPDLVRGRRAMDIGAGCGLVAIAASLAGALASVANDIDPTALRMAGKNAEANGASIIASEGGIMENASHYDRMDIIFLADMFYHNDEARKTAAFVNHAFHQGKTILAADGGRPFFPEKGLSLLEERTLPVSFDVEGVRERRVRLYKITGTI